MTLHSPQAAAVSGDLALADRAVCRRAREVLRSSGYAALSAIECGVTAGILELRGTVGSYYLKQLAQTVVLQVDAVREVKKLARGVRSRDEVRRQE